MARLSKKNDSKEQVNQIDKQPVEVLEEHLKTVLDGKISFGKASWGSDKGPYILAFENSCEADYCECNAHEFKTLNEKDIKSHKVKLWCCGHKTPEEIESLPDLDMESYRRDLKTKKELKKLEKEEKKLCQQDH